MRILRGYRDIAPGDRGASAAIGNFDGVHLGHRAVLDAARRPGAPLGVVTFEPHPREVFAPDAPPFRLMDAQARAHRLEQMGVDRLYELPFDGALMRLTATDFSQHVLADGLGLAHVAVGEDFRFGAGRSGTAASLAEDGARLGFEVTIVRLHAEAGEHVSSTRIREALSDGRPDEAARMLGHLHRVEGEVLHGEKRGRDLGYPTANLSLAGRHLPRFGVYAVAVDVLTGPDRGSYKGVASLGVRPMFGVNRPNLETYLFDYRGDLYGQTLSVGLVAFLRDEAAYEGVDALVAQMGRDSERAKALLA